ncbi:MAG: hypothetical protein ABSA54_12620 [Terriglobales bacterium]|jgi:hypothetical protein
MKYTRPEVTLLAPAAQAVESGSSNKKDPMYPDSLVTSGSSTAYEADE